MRQYELTVLIHPDLEMNTAPAIDKIKKTIESAGGTIREETNEGKKRLAYPIGGQEFAVYYFYTLDLPASAPRKISNAFEITDEIVRYLLVKVDERKVKLEALRKEREAKREGDKEEETKEEE